MAKENVIKNAVRHVYGDDYLSQIDEEEYEQLVSDAKTYFDVFFKRIVEECVLYIKLHLNIKTDFEEDLKKYIVEFIR